MKVSILSAVHNEQDYLSDMIASVRAQTHPDWELVFVSDGSTDRTVDIIKACAAEDSRIHLAGSGAKIGKADAFNAAFTRSTGDLIVLLAGDDTLPSTSLSTRHAALQGTDAMSDQQVAYFKLRTMSEDPTHNNVVLPKGTASSHSGGTITMTRALASLAFPIDGSLPSEDLWLCNAAEGLAERVLERTDVVLNYRIHGGNSNPRQRSFGEMSRAMGARHQAWQALLDCDRFELNDMTRERLNQLAVAERYRGEGALTHLLRDRRISRGNRIAYASMTSPSLFWIKKKTFRITSGLRSR